MPTVEEVARDVTRRLGGRWSGGGGECRCPAHDDREPSMTVRVGATRVIFWCFARCTSTDIVKALLRRGIDPFGVDTEAEASPRRDRNGREQNDRAELAAKVWSASLNSRGTPAERYLVARGIGEFAKFVRFNRAAVLGSGPERQRLPAMIAPVRNGLGMTTIQRTFLDVHDITHKPFPKPKRVLGHPGDGAIRLAAPGDILGLAEGFEDAASAMLWTGLPVWAAMGAERFGNVGLPASVRHLVVFGQNNIASRIGFERAAEQLRANGRTVEFRTPRHHEDWNDAWRAALAIKAGPAVVQADA